MNKFKNNKILTNIDTITVNVRDLQGNTYSKVITAEEMNNLSQSVLYQSNSYVLGRCLDELCQKTYENIPHDYLLKCKEMKINPHKAKPYLWPDTELGYKVEIEKDIFMLFSSKEEFEILNDIAKTLYTKAESQKS